MVVFEKEVRQEEYQFSSVHFSSVAQSCLTLCNPMNYSMPGLPVNHQLPECTKTHVHQVGDAIERKEHASLNNLLEQNWITNLCSPQNHYEREK